jgi:hypothetical protein
MQQFNNVLLMVVVIGFTIMASANKSIDGVESSDSTSSTNKLAELRNEFVIGQVNSDDSIRQLTTLTGLTIAEIEDRARPCHCSKWQDCSVDGFLGENEGFITRLLEDNLFVRQKQLTHQKIAKPLFILATMNKDYCHIAQETGDFKTGQCLLNKITFSVSINCTNGYQESIFNDHLRSSCIVNAVKMPQRQNLSFDQVLLPNYIDRYGFYEGHTIYRVAPQTIIDFFEL